MLALLGYPAGTVLGIWPEVKLKMSGQVGPYAKRFDYTFDYIVAPLGDLTVGPGQDELVTRASTAGYDVSVPSGAISQAPIGAPSIIEIMTSSTSGGNKLKGNTIPQAFTSAILTGSSVSSPGINKRQVWSRMVGQLIVKSQVGLEWGGKTLWVIQDALADYIASTTGLTPSAFSSSETSEVNLVTYSYGDSFHNEEGVIELPSMQLYAGPISSAGSTGLPSFSDMVKAPIIPSLHELTIRLLKRLPASTVLAP